MFDNLFLYAGIGVALVVFAIVALFVLSRRRVVATNEVHVAQTAKSTTMYGKGFAGNAYYKWPSSWPKLGMTTIVLPLTVFDLDLEEYEAYDRERVPFLVDIKAFFRISDPSMAAERISSFQELHSQLTAVVQGAVRTTLANHEIDEIMIDRSKFGEYFTKEVAANVANWGVETIKNIELMDIRDAHNSKVINNIMAKRTSEIEKDSRVKVAENRQKAQVAEIEANRQVELSNQDAKQQIGRREAEVERDVGLAKQQAAQEVALQEKVTAERRADVNQVEQVRQSQIDRDVAVVRAEEKAKVTIIGAEASKDAAIRNAEAELESERRNAEGIALVGEAKAAAERAFQLAAVAPQIALAKEIGGNEGYQKYLLGVDQIKAARDVGIEQAQALSSAEIRINTLAGGSPAEGLSNVMDLIGPKGGATLGMALEAVKAVTGKDTIKEAVTG